MAKTPYGIVAYKGDRKIIRRVASWEEQEALVQEHEADGWKVERDENDGAPSYNERKRAEAADYEYRREQFAERAAKDFQ